MSLVVYISFPYNSVQNKCGVEKSLSYTSNIYFENFRRQNKLN